jgi:hypothetical protein
MKRVWFGRLVALLAVVAVALQLVPYGRSHTNPRVLQEPSWSDPEVRTLAARACFDCHSNETVWPWYSHVAPISWLVQRDVDEGRRVLNFSEWNRSQPEATESAEALAEGEMPPRVYLPLHPGAKLSQVERQLLTRGFAATLGTSEHGED